MIWQKKFIIMMIIESIQAGTLLLLIKTEKKYLLRSNLLLKKKNIFNITSKEWDAAQIEKNNYFIYLVEDTLNNKIKIVAKIQNPAYHAKNNQIEVRVSEYEIRLAR
jgi:hypothetical protein